MNDSSKPRFHTLDELRGFLVFCMVFYHAFYTLSFEFGSVFSKTLYDFFMPAEPFFAGMFILICGISCQFSHSNLTRGLKLLFISLAISFITIVIMPKMGFSECQIYFGILHLLSVGILTVAIANKIIKRFYNLLFFFIFLALFFISYNFSLGYIGCFGFNLELPQSLFKNNYLFFLGAYNDSFFSADYFPIIPWLFLFLCGANIGVYAAAGKFPKFMLKSRVPFLSFLGRHALIIYIIHQPVIFICAALIKRFLHA